MEKNEITKETFQILLFKKMDSEIKIQETVCCEDDGENRVYCFICDK